MIRSVQKSQRALCKGYNGKIPAHNSVHNCRIPRLCHSFVRGQDIKRHKGRPGKLLRVDLFLLRQESFKGIAEFNQEKALSQGFHG